MNKRFVPEGNPIIVTPGGRQNNTTKRMLLGFGLMLLYGLVLGPVVRTLLPKAYLLVSISAAMAVVLLLNATNRRVLYVYRDRIVEKRTLRPAHTFYFYNVTQIKKRRGQKYHIQFGHRRLTIPLHLTNAEAILSSMERYFKHKDNVVPISLLRILKEIQVSA